MTTSLWNACRKPKASRAARAQASGSSPFTWKMGAWTILATSVGYSDDRAASGCGGETQLVVDDDVDGPAGAVAGQLRQVERLGYDPLAGEGGVPVDEEGQHREWARRRHRDGGGRHVAGVRPTPGVLLGPGHAYDHRVDSLEVGRVGGQGHGDRRPRSAGEDSVRALVVLHVARALHRVRVEVALEFLEDLAVGLAHDVGQHVEPPTMGHSHHRLDQAGSGCLVEDGVENHDGRLRAFEAEPLLADIPGVEETLEDLGRVETVENVTLLVG